MYPIIKNISDVLPSIEGRPEFIVVQKDDYTYIDYVFVDGGSFDDPIRRECRGLIFANDDGRTLRRPLEKFDNYGEKGTYDTLDFSIDHIVMDKRDGSMIAPFISNGEVRFGTRAGITEHSIKAEKHLNDHLRQELRTLIVGGFTPDFEWTSPENQIVLKYKKDEIRLLAIRNIITGDYVSKEDLIHYSEVFGVELVDFFETKLSQESIFAYREQTSGVEGFVVFFPSTGFHIKIKTDEYSKMHRAVSFLERENMILPVVLDGLHDDIMPALDEDNQKRLTEYASAVMKEVTEFSENVERDVSYILKEFSTRKEQALWIQKNAKKEFWPAYFRGLDNDEILKHVKQIVLKYPELLTNRW